MNPKVSIIIPCYKSEATLSETLESVLCQEFEKWEAIIVNDGSPDNLEKIALKWVEKDERFKYFKKNNGGLGSARNFGVSKAIGNYIVPLDSDNKIRPDFFLNALNILEKKPKIGVVYGDAQYFGEKNEKWEVGPFSKERMLEHNYIDACTVIRKSLFEMIGGYDESLPFQGHEDWDFWMKVLKTEYDFHYLNQITFDYKVSKDSMIKSFTKEMMNENINYIKKKHFELYVSEYQKLLKENLYLKKEFSLPLIEKVLRKLRIK